MERQEALIYPMRTVNKQRKGERGAQGKPTPIDKGGKTCANGGHLYWTAPGTCDGGAHSPFSR